MPMKIVDMLGGWAVWNSLAMMKMPPASIAARKIHAQALVRSVRIASWVDGVSVVGPGIHE